MTITVYTKPACVQCNATYRALDKAGHRVRQGRHHRGTPRRGTTSWPSATCRRPSWWPVTSTGRASVPTASRRLDGDRGTHRISRFPAVRKENQDEQPRLLLQRVGEHPPIRREARVLPAIRIPLHGRIEVDEPYVLVVPTYGGGRATPDIGDGGYVPKQVIALPQQRAQPVADPRRDRRGQHQLR